MHHAPNLGCMPRQPAARSECLCAACCCADLHVLQRAARSQISTAVSFEGARAAGSAALPSRSLEEESALSAAEGDGKLLA